MYIVNMEIYTLIFLASAYVAGASSVFLQNDLDHMAATLTLRVRVLDNFKSTTKHRVCYFLTNSGNKPFKETGWVLYFNSFRSIEPDHLPLTGSVMLEDQKVKVTLIQGQFTAITPEKGFGMIQPNETRRLYFYNELWSVARCEFFPNWYLSSTSDDLSPRIITSTRNNDFVDSFVKERQWKRYKEDVYNPFTPLERFERNFVKDFGRLGKLVIPTPYRMNISSQEWITLNMSSCKIYANEDLKNEAKFLEEATGCKLEQNGGQLENVIHLTTDDGSSEQYSLQSDLSTNTVQIHGKGAAGVYYGIQTFLSLLYSYKDGRLPVVSIIDRPRFAYRGMHIDIARNFHGVEEIKRLIQVMALYKLNKLHLHLSDDDGWRLEIDGLKELTKVGGRRCHNREELSCLLPQLGSGPFTNTSGTGFYTAVDYQNILRFAKRHHVEVIPEFDFPGHSHAAVRAMEARYQFYTNTGNKSAGNEFRLKDPEDTSRYLSIQEFNDNAINPCIESTYNFIEHIVKTVVDLHRDIQPLSIFHFGGDEVANDAWLGSPACQRLQSNNPNLSGPRAWKKLFVHRVSSITFREDTQEMPQSRSTAVLWNLQREIWGGNNDETNATYESFIQMSWYNLSLGGWEDGFIDEDNEPYRRSILNNSRVVANSWDNVWEWGASMRAYRLANRGYKVVMSQATHLYFDHPAEPDPEEWGLNWATRFTDTKKVFSFIPDSLYENIDTLLSGQKTSVFEICGENREKCDELRERQNVIGIQGQLWSEIVRTVDTLDFMIFPRLLALAERAWHKAEWEGLTNLDGHEKVLLEDWTGFANTLGYKELRRLDDIGIMYRVPLPGASVADSNGGVKICTAFPGLKVQYSKDNGRTWRNVSSQLHLSGEQLLLRTISADGKRYSRSVTLTAPSTSMGHIILFHNFIALIYYILILIIT